MLVEINGDHYDFAPAEIAIHSLDEYGALQSILGPCYQLLAVNIGRCPPDVRIVSVVVDLRVTSGLAHVRSADARRTSTLTLPRH